MIMRHEPSIQWRRDSIYGEWVNIANCIIAEQENMILGDSLDGLNDQIQKQIKTDGPFDVMIILKERQDHG